MRPSQSNANSPFSLQNQTYLNETCIINLDLDEQPQMHSQNAFENFNCSIFTNNFIESHLSIETIHNPSPNETSTQNLSETSVQNPEEKGDDYSLSHIVAVGRNYISVVKGCSRNITRDNANSGFPNSHDYNSCPLPYLSRSSTNLIGEEEQAMTRKHPHASSSSSLRKDTNVMSSILPDHELSRLSNINVDSDYKKWQEWKANAKRARNVQDDEDFHHPSSFAGKDYTNLQTYCDALSKDQVWNGRQNNSSNK